MAHLQWLTDSCKHHMGQSVFQNSQSVFPDLLKFAPNAPQTRPNSYSTAFASVQIGGRLLRAGRQWLLITGNNETDAELQSYENSDDQSTAACAAIVEEATRQR
jgi:hypothetical protein